MSVNDTTQTNYQDIWQLAVPAAIRQSYCDGIPGDLEFAKQLLAAWAQRGTDKLQSGQFSPRHVIQSAVNQLTQFYFKPQWTWEELTAVSNHGQTIHRAWFEVMHLPPDIAIAAHVTEHPLTLIDPDEERERIRQRLSLWGNKLEALERAKVKAPVLDMAG